MKIQSAFLIVAMGSMIACSEDDDSINGQPVDHAQSYFPATAGSYWMYDTYRIEASGAEMIYALGDTVFALSDTVIDGHIYHNFNGKRYTWGPRYHRYLRDSAGYVINQGGHIEMLYTNFEDVLFTQQINSSPLILLTKRMEQFESPLSVAAGTFSDLLDYKSTLFSELVDDGFEGSTSNLYAPGVGQITKTYYYAGQFMAEQTYYEERLVDYYIALP